MQRKPRQQAHLQLASSAKCRRLSGLALPLPGAGLHRARGAVSHAPPLPRGTALSTPPHVATVCLLLSLQPWAQCHSCAPQSPQAALAHAGWALDVCPYAWGSPLLDLPPRGGRWPLGTGAVCKGDLRVQRKGCGFIFCLNPPEQAGGQSHSRVSSCSQRGLCRMWSQLEVWDRAGSMEQTSWLQTGA